MPASSRIGRLLEAIRVDLAAAGIARSADAAPDGRPPLLLTPADGAPAPGETKGNEADDFTVLSLFHTGGLGPGPADDWHRLPTLDLWIRTRKRPPADAPAAAWPGTNPVDRAHAIDDALNDRYDRRRDFVLASGTADATHVLEWRVWREMQPLESSQSQGYTHIVSYLVELPT